MNFPQAYILLLEMQFRKYCIFYYSIHYIYNKGIYQYMGNCTDVAYLASKKIRHVLQRRIKIPQFWLYEKSNMEMEQMVSQKNLSNLFSNLLAVLCIVSIQLFPVKISSLYSFSLLLAPPRSSYLQTSQKPL